MWKVTLRSLEDGFARRHILCSLFLVRPVLGLLAEKNGGLPEGASGARRRHQCGRVHCFDSLSSSCQMKNPRAETANAIMPMLSVRQLNGGKGMWENCMGSQPGWINSIATTCNHASNPKTNIVNANGRNETRPLANSSRDFQKSNQTLRPLPLPVGVRWNR
jgi:hypothetical protein